MYYLDLTTIIRLLKEFRRSGVLRTELPKGVVNTQETCWLQLKLLRGEITDRQIISRTETSIADQKMLNQIEELGPLEWTFVPLKGPSTSSMKAFDNSTPSQHLPVPALPSLSALPLSSLLALVPRRIAAVEHYSLNTLTRQERRVIALVDGKRNVSQIALLLFNSSNIESGARETLTLLQKLEVLKIIALQ